MTLGFGLMVLLNNTSNLAEKILYPLVAAIGVGCLFQTPLIALQAAMPIKDMATSTSTFGFLRTLGGTVGISIGQAIFASVLQKKLKSIPELTLNTSPDALSESVRHLKDISNEATRNAVMHAYARSISTIWLVCTPICGAGFIMILFVRGYSLKRTVVRGKGDLEKGKANEDHEDVAGAPTSPVVSDDDDEKKSIKKVIESEIKETAAVSTNP